MFRGGDHTLAVRCHACGFSGDVLTLVAQVKGLDTRREFTAVLRAAAEAANLFSVLDELDGVASPRPMRRSTRFAVRPSRRVTRETATKPPPPLAPAREEAPDEAALAYDALARALIEACPLRGDAEACGYLTARHIFADAEARDLAALPSFDGQGPILEHLRARFGGELLVAAGLVKDAAATLFRAPAHRLVIPWFHPDGRIVSLQRRVLGPTQGKVPKYVFPFDRPLPEHPFDVQNVALAMAMLREQGHTPEVAYVEGALDALAMNALLRRLPDASSPPPRVVLGLPSASKWRYTWADYARGCVAHVALDEDKAGLARVQEIARDLYVAGAAKVLRTRPLSGKDWNEQLDRVS